MPVKVIKTLVGIHIEPAQPAKVGLGIGFVKLIPPSETSECAYYLDWTGGHREKIERGTAAWTAVNEIGAKECSEIAVKALYGAYYDITGEVCGPERTSITVTNDHRARIELEIPGLHTLATEVSLPWPIEGESMGVAQRVCRDAMACIAVHAETMGRLRDATESARLN